MSTPSPSALKKAALSLRRKDPDSRLSAPTGCSDLRSNSSAFSQAPKYITRNRARERKSQKEYPHQHPLQAHAQQAMALNSSRHPHKTSPKPVEQSTSAPLQSRGSGDHHVSGPMANRDDVSMLLIDLVTGFRCSAEATSKASILPCTKYLDENCPL